MCICYQSIKHHQYKSINYNKMEANKYNDNSNLFNVDPSESISVQDLHLFDKNTKICNGQQKIYVQKFEQQSRPFSVVVKPYLDAFLHGAGTAAGTAAGIGQQALHAVSKAFWWGYQGIKNLFNKTAEYVKPKFVFVTQKSQPNQQQLQLIEKLNRDKQMAVLGIGELNELKPKDNGKCQIVVPADKQFLEYLRNEKYIINKQQWGSEIDPTKSIMMPSESFAVVLNTFQAQKAPLPKKQVFDYGNFCVFEMEGKNEIEYEFLNKLRMSKEHIQGYMVRTDQVYRQDSSNDSKPEHQALITNSQFQTTQKPIPTDNKLTSPIQVKVKQVALISDTSQEQSRQILLN